MKRVKNSGISKVSAVFNPLDFMHGVFGKKPNELKAQENEEDDNIRKQLASRYDREMLMVLLNINRF